MVLDTAVQLDSRRFRELGDTGRLLEQQMLDLLGYVAELQRRKQLEQQRTGSAAEQSGKKIWPTAAENGLGAVSSNSPALGRRRNRCGASLRVDRHSPQQLVQICQRDGLCP